MNSQLPKCVLKHSKIMLATACLFSSGITYAAMNADSTLDFVAAAGGTTTLEPTSGSWFSMEVTAGTFIYTPIGSLEGVKLGTIQPASGSHSGAVNGSESPSVDDAWAFFGNTGMHQTTSAATTLTDDTAGNVTLDFSGWSVTWNGIDDIPMGSGVTATVTCAATCEYGDTYVLDYSGVVPPGDPSSFGGVNYAVHLEGGITQQAAINTAPVANDDPATGSISVDRKATGRLYTAPVIDVVVNDTDADGNGDIDRTTVTIQADVSNGTTSVDPVTGNVTYTPNDDYLGPDSFTYTVTDLGGPQGAGFELTSNVATVSIDVANAVPVAGNDSATVDTATDTFVDIDVTSNDTDSDGTIDTTTVTLGSPANNGSTAINPVTGVITYTPTPGYIGQDAFTYTVNDNDGVTSNEATVIVTVANSALGVLEDDDYLIMFGGNVTDALIEPPLGQGSWFSMEVQPGSPLHTAIVGFNHLQLGALQPASSSPLVPDIDQGWVFFGNIGVHQTTSPVTILTDDTAGNVTLGMTGWDVSWNAIPSIPLGSGTDNGVGTLTCYTDLATLAQGDCSHGDLFVLEYRAIVPPGDPSGFGGVPYRLHMEGFISDTEQPIGGICITNPADPACAFVVDVAAAINEDGTPLVIDPGSKAVAADNTTGFGLTAAEIGVNDPLKNPNNGEQCIGGCADFVIMNVTGNYIDIVFKLDKVIPQAGTQIRKLKNNIWDDFDSSGGDLVGSAQSSGGLCQGPEGVFAVGLREGNDCIYMRISDGGVNDTNGLKDGIVEDPSGVLLAGSPNVPPGSTSGCSIASGKVTLIERADWLLLAGFLLLLLAYRRRQTRA